MTRQERALVLVTLALVVLFALAIALGVAGELDRHPWYIDGANLLQWIGSLSTIAGLSMLAWWYWSRRCAQNHCVRLGEHPVKGTRKKVCHHHHTHTVHALIQELHHVEGVLGWGESPDHKEATT